MSNLRKPKNVLDDADNCGKLHQRTMNVMNRHLRAWKAVDDDLMKGLNEVIKNVNSNYESLKDNFTQMSEQLMSINNDMKQTVAAHNDKLKALEGIVTKFKNECEEIEAVQRIENEKDIKKMKQKHNRD